MPISSREEFRLGGIDMSKAMRYNKELIENGFASNQAGAIIKISGIMVVLVGAVVAAQKIF